MRIVPSSRSLRVPLLVPLAALLASAPGAQLTPSGTPSAGGNPCFGGTGGPNGDFDWVVHTGELFFFDTTLTIIDGGPGGIPTTTETAVNGIVDVRNLTVEEGGEIRVQGPNPMRILATGEVTIRGLVDLSGFNGHDVATLNTGNQVEIGGAGSAGGGRGGNGNPVTTASTPRGGDGNGPFGQIGGGGQGGESGYAPAALGKNARRPGGGGGGSFARDQAPTLLSMASTTFGTAASAGNPGNVDGTGAVSGTNPAAGGVAGPSVFTDAKPENDFFGVRLRGGHGLTSLMRGELAGLWAGSGGGAGGNAVPAATFPNPNWTFSTDEKGGAGGGAGGALQVQALGAIVFGAAGEIRSNGGRGGTGENTNFLDHIGGTGGGGSGGHVVLETATRIDFSDGGTNTSALPRTWLAALGPVKRTGSLTDVQACCRLDSNGGAGGPGVIQLHVPDPLAAPGVDPSQTDIVVPASLAGLRNPLASVATPVPIVLLPTCDPFPRTSLGWFGGAGTRLLQSLLAPDLDGAPELEIPRW